MPPSVLKRIAHFEKTCADAVDAQLMDDKISRASRARHKQYDFCSGLKRDLLAARAAIRQCARQINGVWGCTFRHLFDSTNGEIANLNRILQNLKGANEVAFSSEFFLIGVNDDSQIKLLEKFWLEEYAVDRFNIFRWDPYNQRFSVNRKERKGRSYTQDNLATSVVSTCYVCSGSVSMQERMTLRGRVYHLKCMRCVVCGSCPSQRIDYMAFDGSICCRLDCLQSYDGAHIKQQRK